MNSYHEQYPNSDLNSVQVATPSEQARSRPQNDVATPSSTGQVVTSFPGRDLLDDQAMSRRQPHVATSIPNRPGHDVSCMSRPPRDLTYVATSNPCRDLPHCRPCRDLKNDVATSTQLSPISATSRRHFFFHVATWGFSLLVVTGISLFATQARPACLAPSGRDLLVRS